MPILRFTSEALDDFVVIAGYIARETGFTPLRKISPVDSRRNAKLSPRFLALSVAHLELRSQIRSLAFKRHVVFSL